MKKKLKLLFGTVLVLCALVCMSLFFACADPSEPNGPSDEDKPQVGNTFNPVLTCEIKTASVSAEAGQKLNSVTLSFKAETALYTSEEEYLKGNAYQKSDPEMRISLMELDESEKMYVTADEDLEINVKNILSKPWNVLDKTFIGLNLSSLFSSYCTDFISVNGYSQEVSSADYIEYILYAQELEQFNMLLSEQIKSCITVELKSNESNPKNLNVTLRGDWGARLVPYVYYRYSELGFDNEEVNITFTKEDFAELGSLADSEGFCIKTENFSFNKKYKGVHYTFNISASADSMSNVSFVTDAYYGLNLTEKLYFKTKEVLMEDGHRTLKFSPDDISFANTDHEGLRFGLKIYKNTDYESYNSSINITALNYISPEAVTVSVPDMLVTEASEKIKDIAFTMAYPDGYEKTVAFSECKTEAVSTPDGGNLEDGIKRASAGKQEWDLYIYNGYRPALQCRAFFTLTEVLGYAKFNNIGLLEETFYEYQRFEIPDGLKIVEYYYASYNQYQSRQASVTRVKDAGSDFAEACNEKIEAGKGINSVSIESVGMATPEQCDVYLFEVLEDTVSSIKVKFSDTFGGIIVGEPIDVRDCFVKATFAHGQQAEIPLTTDMLGEYSETTGEQDVEITFRDASETVEMLVRKVKNFAVEEGLDRYYLLNDEPSPEVWLKVTFTDNEYDYILLPEGRADGLDLSIKGKNSLTLTYGGVNVQFSYEVIEGVYITYTQSGGSITLNKFNIGLPAEEVTAWIPEDAKNIVLPSEIEGVPVTALGANLFKNQTILRTLTVPDSVTQIGYGLADGCTNLEKLTVSGSIPLKYHFSQYKSATAVSSKVFPNIPQKLEVVISGERLCDGFLGELYCAESGLYVPKLTLGGNIASLGEQDAYALQSVKEFKDGGSSAVYADGNIIYTDGGETLYYYSAYKKNASFTIPAGVKTANISSNFIEELTIPAFVVTLGEGFMDNAEALTSVKIAKDSLITELPDSAFSNCTNLTVFNFPENLEKIGGYVMRGVNLDKIILPQSVTAVGANSFENAKCTHLYIPTGATQSFVTGSFISLPNLQKLAYDGSVALAKLSPMADSFSRQTVEMYITGEKASVGDSWYTPAGNQKVSKIYVCREASDFSKYYFSGTVVDERNGGTFDKWWL